MSHGWTIAIQTKGDVARKVTKILPLSDGGFAIVSPYHKARAGHLFKMPINKDHYEPGEHQILWKDCQEFSASDRVKLSYHVDGFAQFSGEDSRRIVSGRDAETGAPRGLGLFAKPLNDPISSGPAAAIMTWGLHDFDPLPENKKADILFTEEDAYYRDCTPETANSWILLIYTISKKTTPAIFYHDGRSKLNVNTEFISPNMLNIVTMDVIEMARECPVRLGVYLNRMKLSGGSPSGWHLSGPGDHGTDRPGFVLMARYPVARREGAVSLDRPPA